MPTVNYFLFKILKTIFKYRINIVVGDKGN